MSAEKKIYLELLSTHLLTLKALCITDTRHPNDGQLFWRNIMHTKWSTNLWLISLSFCALTEPSWFPHSLNTTLFLEWTWAHSPGPVTFIETVQDLISAKESGASQCSYCFRSTTEQQMDECRLILRCLNTQACFQYIKFMNSSGTSGNTCIKPFSTLNKCYFFHLNKWQLLYRNNKQLGEP